MFRAILGRTAPLVAVSTSFAVLNSNISQSTSSSLDDDIKKATNEVLDFSPHKTLGDLKAAGEKRRNDSDCGFCEWMTAGPCSDIYKSWDNCVHESKDVNKEFVEVCRPFTLGLMECIKKYPDYYKELAQVQADADKKKELKNKAIEWDWKNEVSDSLVNGPVFSLKSPGKWIGKEGKHVPQVKLLNNINGQHATITVEVNHGMSKEHFIEYIWARDEDTGKIIGIIKLTPDMKKAELIFDVPTNVKSITAFEKCNLHGVWKSETISC